MQAYEEQKRSGIDTEWAERYFSKTVTFVYLHNERHICVPIIIKNLLPCVLLIRV
jgi:hypothetical protein